MTFNYLSHRNVLSCSGVFLRFQATPSVEEILDVCARGVDDSKSCYVESAELAYFFLPSIIHHLEKKFIISKVTPKI